MLLHSLLECTPGFDYITFYATIAGLGAAIAAILGGLFFSGVRRENRSHSRRLRKSINDLNDRLTQGRTEVKNANYAYDFIEDNLNDLLRQVDTNPDLIRRMNEFVNEGDRGASVERIADYWRLARSIHADCLRVARNEVDPIHSARMAIETYATRYAQNNFTYRIFRLIHSRVIPTDVPLDDSNHVTNDDFISESDLTRGNLIEIYNYIDRYIHDNMTILEQDPEIQANEMQLGQLRHELKTARKWRLTILAITIFCGFSLTCVLLPIIFICLTANGVCYNELAALNSVSLLFAVFLVAIIIYVIVYHQFNVDNDR